MSNIGANRAFERLNKAREKMAFVPPPPGDPSAGGGMPPMDPAMMGGGGMPPPMPPSDPLVSSGGTDVRSMIRDELAAAGLVPSGKPGQGKAPKADINTIATDVFQLKKMIFHLIKAQGLSLPDDILDGPNRDPETGAPASSPTGGSDAPPGSSKIKSTIQPIDPMASAFPGGEKSSQVALDEEYDETVAGTPISRSTPRTVSKAAAMARMIKRSMNGRT